LLHLPSQHRDSTAHGLPGRRRGLFCVSSQRRAGLGAGRRRAGLGAGRRRAGLGAGRRRAGLGARRGRAGLGAGRRGTGLGAGRRRAGLGAGRRRAGLGAGRRRAGLGARRRRAGLGAGWGRARLGLWRRRARLGLGGRWARLGLGWWRPRLRLGGWWRRHVARDDVPHCQSVGVVLAIHADARRATLSAGRRPGGALERAQVACRAVVGATVLSTACKGMQGERRLCQWPDSALHSPDGQVESGRVPPRLQWSVAWRWNAQALQPRTVPCLPPPPG
jgi:hypothetical protein